MATGTVWQCDRCKMIVHNFDDDARPDDWAERSMPVRGSEGARSHRMVTLCLECDDELYDWLHYHEKNPL